MIRAIQIKTIINFVLKASQYIEMRINISQKQKTNLVIRVSFSKLKHFLLLSSLYAKIIICGHVHMF